MKRAEVAAKALAVLGEGRKTSREVAEALGIRPGGASLALRRLRDAGKVALEGSRWRLTGPAVSPLREDEGTPEDAPAVQPGKPGKALASVPELVLGALAYGPLTAHALWQRLAPQMGARGRSNVSNALSVLARAGKILWPEVRRGPWRLVLDPVGANSFTYRVGQGGVPGVDFRDTLKRELERTLARADKLRALLADWD